MIFSEKSVEKLFLVGKKCGNVIFGEKKCEKLIIGDFDEKKCRMVIFGGKNVKKGDFWWKKSLER